jgi:CheY-like chemotaxis protein
MYLEDLGLAVLEAPAPDVALELCELHGGPIDLLVSDMVMPIKSGPELAKLLRPRYPEMRVLFMSASQESVVTDAAGGERVAMLLKKPFVREELAVKLAELMGVALPVDQPAAPAFEVEALAPRERTAMSAPATSRTILLVEDEHRSRLALVQLLGDSGYRIIAAASAGEALEAAAARGGAVDLLLTDLRLPDFEGGELARQLRASYPALRVVYMSGMPNPPDDGSSFVQKPVDIDVLLETLQRALAD